MTRDMDVWLIITIIHIHISVFMNVLYLLARLMDRGLGGGTSRQTEGTSISRPPGPVTSHLLRSELSFRMPMSSLQITFCSDKERKHGNVF